MLRRVRATLLLNAATGQQFEVGQKQPQEAYPQELWSAVGRMVAELHRDGYIAHHGVTEASRKTRRRCVARVWIALDVEACRRLAEEDLKILEMSADQIKVDPQNVQRTLFDDLSGTDK